MIKLRTDDAIIDALRKVATKDLSARDVHEQRVSFVMASFKESNGVTRAKIEKILATQNGK